MVVLRTTPELEPIGIERYPDVVSSMREAFARDSAERGAASDRPNAAADWDRLIGPAVADEGRAAQLFGRDLRVLGLTKRLFETGDIQPGTLVLAPQTLVPGVFAVYAVEWVRRGPNSIETSMALDPQATIAVLRAAGGGTEHAIEAYGNASVRHSLRIMGEFDAAGRFPERVVLDFAREFGGRPMTGTRRTLQQDTGLVRTFE